MQSEHITLAADQATSEPATVERVTLQGMFARSTPASHKNEPKAAKSGANPYLTAEHWRKVIAGSTRGLTAEQIAAAAENAAEKTRNGIQAAAWHEAAVVTGTLATCNCVPCVNNRRATRSSCAASK